MFCIAAFIVFCILGIFSASYRELAKKAWYCVLRRVTLKPCDIGFDEEIKSKLLAKILPKAPWLAKFVMRWGNWIAGIFVFLSIWSLWIVLNSGLNLFVYDTCYPQNAESCSLSGEACGVAQNQLTLGQAWQEGKMLTWVTSPVTDFATTISRVPDRLKKWEARDYTTMDSSYYYKFDESKPVALVIIDPGCIYCRKMFGNEKTADLMNTHNLTYLPYPIPKGNGEYKFVNSVLITQYLEALKRFPLANAKTPADWQLLEKIWTEQAPDGMDWQVKFDQFFDASTAEHKLQEMLVTLGYSGTDIEKIKNMAHSSTISEQMLANKTMVEDKIRTIKIPTILLNGRRFDRVVGPDQLK